MPPNPTPKPNPNSNRPKRCPNYDRPKRFFNSDKMKTKNLEKSREPLTPEEEAWKRDLALHRQKTTWLIHEGDNHDVQKILCSTTRDFLIKFGPKEKGNHLQVKINQLSGKHVVLYFAWLSKGSCKVLYHDDLEETYNDLVHQGQFEVVFVALGNNLEEIFNSLFSKMPWLAIPYEDIKARQELQEKFAIPRDSAPITIMFAPNGTVMETDCAIFRAYGAEGFPFTEDKLDQVEQDDRALLEKLYMKKLSFTELLGNNVTTFEGKQVSTSCLEGKTVGLYFYEGSSFGIKRTRKLKKIWESVRSRLDIDFEIVVDFSLTVHHSSCKTKFKDEFKSIPWYTLSGSGRKLSRVLKVDVLCRPDASLEAGYLIILQPNESPPSLNYFAFDIFDFFGITAYPFDLEKAVRLYKRDLEETLALDKLLSLDAPLYRGCFGCGEYSSCNRCSTCSRKDNIAVSDILGKHVLLLFATHSCYESGKFLRELKRMYSAMQATDGCFEIIYISLDCVRSQSSFPKCIHEMLWLVYPFLPDFASSLLWQLFEFEHPYHLPAIAAFGPAGHLVAKESNLAFKKEWSSEFPFIKILGKEEVCKELVSSNKWDLELVFPGISSIS